jgi:hypothetical protein
MTTVFFLAFIVDHDIRERGHVVVEAGIDLLAGPYPTRAVAETAIREACRAHPRLAAFAGLATYLTGAHGRSPVRLEVIPVSFSQLVNYNDRHHHAALPWPPPVVTPTATAQIDRVPKKTLTTPSLRKGATHATA